jgi:hypothetical protein
MWWEMKRFMNTDRNAVASVAAVAVVLYSVER